MLKFHPIPAFMKTYTNFKKIFLVRVYWLKYIIRIKFKIPILDLMSLPKTVFHLKGYTLVVCSDNTKLSTDGPLVSKLADHVSLYKQRLEQFRIGSLESDIHSFRFKDKLLA